MRTGLAWMAAVLAVLAGAANAQDEKGRWHPVENIPGCTVWNPNPQSGETVTWSGSCVAGKAEGQGTLTWRYREDGKEKEGRNTGTLAAGKFVGRNTYTDSDGLRFEGDDNGRGVMTWASGNRYEGDFRDGRFHGRGVFAWANGNRYEGEFRDGTFHGRGVLTATGDRYEGEFRNGKRTGQAIMIWRDGTRFEGPFLDGKPAGAGTCARGGRTGRCLIENTDIRWLD